MPFANSDESSIFLANISYAYLLMAESYREAAQRIKKITKEPTTGQAALGFTLACMRVAVTGVAQGLGAALFDAIIDSDPVKAGAGSVTDMISDRVIDQFRDRLGTERWTSKSNMDPLDFIISMEKKLRSLTVGVTHKFNDIDEMEVSLSAHKLSQHKTISALKKDHYWGFLFQQQSKDFLDRKWKEIKEVLDVSMRRLAWQTYCRSQWKNRLWNYTIGVKSKEAIDDILKRSSITKTVPTDWHVEPASDWHYKVWDHGLSTPAYWEDICADFKGPEHDGRCTNELVTSQHPQDKRDLLSKRCAWISMAAVHCCQINVNKLKVTSGQPGNSAVPLIAIDLDGRIDWLRISHESKNDYKIIISGEIDSGKEEHVLLAGTRRTSIAISEVRIGASEKTTAAKISGKKGRWEQSNATVIFLPNAKPRLDHPYEPAERIAKKARMTIQVVSSSWSFSQDVHWVILELAYDYPDPSGQMSYVLSEPNKGALNIFGRDGFVNILAPDKQGVYILCLDSRQNFDKSVAYSPDGFAFTVF